MGATLRYAKVIDADRFQQQGTVVDPGTESIVRLPGEAPSTALAFLVVRAWDDIDQGGMTETWQVRGPNGETVREGHERVVLADQGQVTDELDDVEFAYADDGYQLVLNVDGREVARVDFPVRIDETGQRLAT